MADLSSSDPTEPSGPPTGPPTDAGSGPPTEVLPPTGPPTGPPTDPPTGSGDGTDRPAWLVPGAVALVIAVIVAFLVSSGGGGDDETASSTSTSAAGSGEIFLQPIAELGPDPFGPTVAAASPSTTIDPLTPVTLGSGNGGPPPTAPVFNPGRSSGGTSTSVNGATPGLYGGTRDQSSCDKQRLIDFLVANPDKAAAWASVQGIPASQITSYINTLTPVLLRSDTRVTNHGFKNGRATPIQSVLQAGTAVLVDQYGLPRARCACGNPLIPPQPVPQEPVFKGTPWDGFSPGSITVINSSTTVINVITIIDVTTGTPFGRPPGGGPDLPLPPGGVTTTTTTPGATTTLPTQGTTTTTRGATGTGTVWQLKEIKVWPGGHSPQPNYSVVTPPSATGGEILTTVGDGGLCNGTGTSTTRMRWTFGRDVSTIRNGDAPITGTLVANNAGATGSCTPAHSTRVFFTISGSDGDGSLAAGAFQPGTVDGGRFSGQTPRAVGDEGQQTGGQVTVSSAPSNPNQRLAWFSVKVEYPGGQFYVLYIYELR